MADDDAHVFGQWLIDNQDKVGTPAYVTVKEAFNRTQQQAAGPGMAQRAMNTIGSWFATPPPRNADGSVPDIKDVRQDPYGAGATADRIALGAVTGIPDLAISVANMAARASDHPESQIPTLRERAMAMSNTPELPADASTTRRLLEAGGSALLGGGASMAKAAFNAAPSLMQGAAAAGGTLLRDVVAPTVASYVGAQGADALLPSSMDPQTRQLIGGAVGGFSPAVAQAAARAGISSYYGTHAAPNAPEVAAASERAGITPTPGMLGDQHVRDAEKAAEAKIGSQGLVRNARDQTLDQMVNTAEKAAADRTNYGPGQSNVPATLQAKYQPQAGMPAPPPLPTTPQRGTIYNNETTTGDVAAATARDAIADLSAGSSRGQQRLMDRVGPNTPVPVQGIFDRAYGLMTDPETSVPTAQAVDRRVTQQLAPRINRDAAGDPIHDASGSPTVPYGAVRSFRSDLGRSFDQGATPPATKQLYGPVTEAMETAATRAGVPLQDFRNVQARTRDVQALSDVLTPLTEREGTGAANWLRAGETANPERLRAFEAATRGDPRLGNVMGSHIQNMVDETIGQGGARGPANFANRIEQMHPDALDVIGGPQAQRLQDIATAARAYDRPTSQTGLTRAMSNVSHGQTVDQIAALAAMLMHKVQPYVANAAVAGLPAAYRAGTARMMLSPSAYRGLTGAPTTIRDLLPSLEQVNAAAAARR